MPASLGTETGMTLQLSVPNTVILRHQKGKKKNKRKCTRYAGEIGRWEREKDKIRILGRLLGIIIIITSDRDP